MEQNDNNRFRLTHYLTIIIMIMNLRKMNGDRI